MVSCCCGLLSDGVLLVDCQRWIEDVVCDRVMVGDWIERKAEAGPASRTRSSRIALAIESLMACMLCSGEAWTEKWLPSNKHQPQPNKKHISHHFYDSAGWRKTNPAERNPGRRPRSAITRGAHFVCDPASHRLPTHCRHNHTSSPLCLSARQLQRMGTGDTSNNDGDRDHSTDPPSTQPLQVRRSTESGISNCSTWFGATPLLRPEKRPSCLRGSISWLTFVSLGDRQRCVGGEREEAFCSFTSPTSSLLQAPVVSLSRSRSCGWGNKYPNRASSLCCLLVRSLLLLLCSSEQPPSHESCVFSRSTRVLLVRILSPA